MNQEKIDKLNLILDKTLELGDTRIEYYIDNWEDIYEGLEFSFDRIGVVSICKEAHA